MTKAQAIKTIQSIIDRHHREWDDIKWKPNPDMETRLEVEYHAASVSALSEACAAIMSETYD